MRPGLGTFTNRGRRSLRLVVFLGTALALQLGDTSLSRAQTSAPPLESAAPGPAAAHGGKIYGAVKAGTIPLGGVRIAVTNSQTGDKYIAITDGAGKYSVTVANDGRYSVQAIFRSSTASAKVIVLGPASSRNQKADFAFEGSIGGTTLASLWPSLILPPAVVNTLSMQPALTNTGGNSGGQFPSFTGDPDFSGDTFVVTGQALIVIPYFQMADQTRQDFEDGHQLQGPSMQLDSTSAALPAGAAVTASSNSASANPVHGVAFWNGGNSTLNAAPYVLAGQPSPNPSYYSNNYGFTVGGEPFVPWLTRPSPRDFALLSYSGQLSTSLVNDYGIVPTELERQGNFSELVGTNGQLIPIYPPRSMVPYPNNTIDTALSPQALGLLKYLPEPNLQSAGYNYRLLTTQGTHSNTMGLSCTHYFGSLPSGSSPNAGKIVDNSQGLTQTINFNFNWGEIANDVVNIFPALGGNQRVQGYYASGGYTAIKGEWITNINLISTRNNYRITNYYTSGEDIATKLGLLADSTGMPINTNPLNYGLPNLIFNNFTGFSETQPNSQLTQTSGVSGSSSWTHNSHIVRFGGDLRRIDFNIFGGTDATGSFVFTGGYTQIEGDSAPSPVPTSGSSFADFLLGDPQQAKIEAPYQKAYARQTNWDLFVRDDWHVLPSLTILAGLRYDYFSPFIEKYNRLSTLDYNSNFSDIAPVQPNGIGPVTGTKYPRSLVNPDRNNFSPHLGFAWQAARNTTFRGAYDIDYTVAQYGSFFQDLAYQPPFADVQINGNIPHIISPYNLQYGFGSAADDGNYAINKNYRVPYLQLWYLDVEQVLPLNIVLDVGYTGSKGTKLDVISAPGWVNSTVFSSAYFDFEDSAAFSNFNALVVRATRRLGSGLAVQATYSYSHSIDDASSVNVDSPVVVQNSQDILAEESNSSFDVRHQVTGSFLYQLPFGANKPYLATNNWVSHVVANLSFTGFFQFATGVPLTPYISASVAEVERGTHGSVRPNRVPGVSITAGGGHLDHWFNTAAFSTNFAPNQLFGTASRYCIPGPGVENVNLSLSKLIGLRGTKSLELRATGNNVFNIVQYSGVNTQIGYSTFGSVSGVQPMRQITFLARFRF